MSTDKTGMHGKEKVYGSIPLCGSVQLSEFFRTSNLKVK